MISYLSLSSSAFSCSALSRLASLLLLDAALVVRPRAFLPGLLLLTWVAHTVAIRFLSLLSSSVICTVGKQRERGGEDQGRPPLHGVWPMQRVLRQCPPIEAAILPGAKASKRTMRDLRATQSLVPKARTKNPVQFSSTLVRFSSTPVRFSLTRVQFSSTLVRFSSTPAWFSLTRVRFPSTPVQFSVRFSLTPVQFSSTLVLFSSTPVRFSLTRVQFSSTLVRFSSTPVRFSVRFSLTPVQFSSTLVQFSSTLVRFSSTRVQFRCGPRPRFGFNPLTRFSFNRGPDPVRFLSPLVQFQCGPDTASVFIGPGSLSMSLIHWPRFTFQSELHLLNNEPYNVEQ